MSSIAAEIEATAEEQARAMQRAGETVAFFA
jgi:hypothetical protein